MVLPLLLAMVFTLLDSYRMNRCIEYIEISIISPETHVNVLWLCQDIDCEKWYHYFEFINIDDLTWSVKTDTDKWIFISSRVTLIIQSLHTEMASFAFFYDFG